MPTYSYECGTCGATQTETFAIDVTLPPPTCEQCNKPMQRRYETPAVTFKGTGWAHKDKKGTKNQ